MSFELTLSSIPPPLEYLIVKVVLLGANPYASVLRKLLGSKAEVSFEGLPGRLEPTFVGLGIISSSGLLETPAPKRMSVSSSSFINVVNLLAVFLSFKI